MAVTRPALTVVILLMTFAAPAPAQNATEPIRYTLRFPAPQTHYIEVSASVPTDRRAMIDLMMAVWTPGSYLIREYERNVEAVAAAGADDRPLLVTKTDKNRWQVSTGGAPRITVTYRVYAREMSVRTNWVEAGYALINGAPTFLTLTDGVTRPHEVTLVPARGWARSVTSLPETGEGAHRYRAPDFDTLVDSPILLGNPTVYQFEVGGKTHYLVNEGEAGVFDGARAAKDLETIVKQHERTWGSLPYEKYLFLNILSAPTGQSGNGLEHRNSSVLMDWRFATRTRSAYLSWLTLASHEHFHAWNGKRLRPVELGPFDYQNENLTRSLWIVEGLTTYYADLTVHRAGLSTRDEYLQGLSSRIEEMESAPGRLVQPLELASFDAWIKYYRPDENSTNVSISYYTKGALVGFLLDARIRRDTKGAKSLDDAMRAAYQKYSAAKGYTPDEFRAVIEQTAGAPLESFWKGAIQGTSELDYAGALDTFGLRLRPPDAGQPSKAWIGAAVRNDQGRLVVSQVRRDTPAFAAGVNVDDEILAIDDMRVRADRWDNRLEQYKPGDRVSFLVARREQLVRLDVTFGNEPPKRRVEIAPGSTTTQQQQLSTWLSA